MPDHLSQNRRLPRLFWGVLLIGLGATLLIDNFTEVVYISGRDVRHLWPVILILGGIGKMTGTVGRQGDGFGLTLLGAWFLLNHHVSLGLSRDLAGPHHILGTEVDLELLPHEPATSPRNGAEPCGLSAHPSRRPTRHHR